MWLPKKIRENRKRKLEEKRRREAEQKRKSLIVGLSCFGVSILLILFCVVMWQFENASKTNSSAEINTEATQSNEIAAETPPAETENPTETPTETPTEEAKVATSVAFDLSSVPTYSGKPYVAINNNVPYFSESDYTTQAFENYSALDKLGRCGVAYANVCIDIMPTEERGSIGQVKPTGWHTVKYDSVDGKYLYNRCHLIGYQLSAENANTKNLITGTRYLNVDGMLPFENMVADYVKETHHHVLYRVTPVFDGNNLLAAGVLMEALSVEDKGAGICYNVYCYNVQPGIAINYADGSSSGGTSSNAAVTPSSNQSSGSSANQVKSEYVTNKNTKKFHKPSCSSVKNMKESNKEYLNCTRDEAIARGYDPCQNCNP